MQTSKKNLKQALKQKPIKTRLTNLKQTTTKISTKIETKMVFLSKFQVFVISFCKAYKSLQTLTNLYKP